MAAFSACAAFSKSAFAASFTVSKFPGVCTPLMAVSPAVLASATLSAFSAAVILASSSAFLVSTAVSFSLRSASVKLLSAAISAFSACAAFSKSAFAAATIVSLLFRELYFSISDLADSL